ncbi:MAG: porin family protein [Longimicrobiales bacterium]
MNKIKMLATVAATAGALFTFQSTLTAQTIGFKGGMSFSKLDVENDDDPQDYLKKFVGGGFIRMGLGGMAVQAELLASTKGTVVPQTTFDGETSLKLDYIEVPVLLRFGLGMAPLISPYVMVGPTFGFQTGCNAEITSGTDNVSADCQDTIDTKKFDVGATGVAGVEFKAGPGSILIEGRYTHGLTNISNDDTSNSLKNRSYAVLAGYSISLR